jgi:hypothetical protein
LTKYEPTEKIPELFGTLECKLDTCKCPLNSLGSSTDGRFTYDFKCDSKILSYARLRMLSALEEEERLYEPFLNNGSLVAQHATIHKEIIKQRML